MVSRRCGGRCLHSRKKLVRWSVPRRASRSGHGVLVGVVGSGEGGSSLATGKLSRRAWASELRWNECGSGVGSVGVFR